MIEKLRQKILRFINSPKDVPLLAGFSIGLYMVLYYYSKNFSLANSWQQLLFFTAYYMVMPIALLFLGYKLFSVAQLAAYKKHFLFVAIPGFMLFFLLQLSFIGVSKRGFFIAGIALFVAMSFKLKDYYKFFVVLILFLSIFNALPILKTGYMAATSLSDWKKMPDDILNVKFKERPNVYYIQPDGYASFRNLKDSNHNFDNSAFEGFLSQNGFTLYEDFRSNYFSTLLSNSSIFSMKHHYIEGSINSYGARNVIVGENPVLSIFKNNKYKTHFISQKPYLVINRPRLGYDYSNIDYDDLPYLKDGWENDYDVTKGVEDAMQSQSSSGNFYFIEKLVPEHITNLKVYTDGKVKEREKYLKLVKEANGWLQKTIAYIALKDPDALIIIAADHGGFVGFDYTLQCLEHTNDKLLVKSIYGAAAAIRWNNPQFKEYDGKLKTSVNLFRTVFSFLAKDKKYLNYLEEDASYIKTEKPTGLFKYIDAKGNVVFDKKE